MLHTANDWEREHGWTLVTRQQLHRMSSTACDGSEAVGNSKVVHER